MSLGPKSRGDGKTLKKILPIIVGISIIGALIWWAGTEGVIAILKEANPWLLGLAFLAYLGGIVAWTLRWQVLLEGVGVKVGFKDTFVALFIGIFFNNVTPGARGGGEAVRVYYLAKRSEGSYGTIFATVTADRILDIVPVMIMLLISAGYLYVEGISSLFVITILLSVLLSALTGLATLIITSERRIERILHWIFGILLRIIPSRIKKYEEKFENLLEVNLPQFSGSLRVIGRNRRVFSLSMFYSFLTWFFVILRNYLVFLALGYRIGFLAVMTVQMVATSVGLISIIPGGAGLIEATTSGSYVLLGVTKEMAVTSSIVDRVISFWFPIVLGGILITHFGLKPKER